MDNQNIIVIAIQSVGVLMNSLNAYFSGERARPEINKRALCQHLKSLRSTLKAIAETGQSIGDLLITDTFRSENDPGLQELIELLKCQNRNIREAEAEFSYLGDVFEIKCPELYEIRLHLRGKSDRIDLIYSAVGTADLTKRLGKEVAGWETSELIGGPAELAPCVNRGRAELTIRRPEDADHDYKALVESIEPLTRFIDKSCDAHLLM